MAVLVMNNFTSNAFVIHLPCRKYTSFTVMHQTRTRLLLDHGKGKQAIKQTEINTNKPTPTNSVPDR